MKPIIAIRPEPGFARTVALGREMGLAITGAPLFEVRPCAWQPPPADAFDAVLVGSANALRHGGPALATYRHLPVHAVGLETARAARDAGFDVARTGSGGLQKLLDTATAPLRYLRLAGAAHVALALPPGSSVDTRIVYESAALPLPEALAATLRQGALVLLHSGAAARHFDHECKRLSIERQGMMLAALAPRIAALAGDGWAGVRYAARAEESALLALAQDMCH